ncbi:MAG TPA: DUF362 domain-containing protein [Candidatus Hydrogenedentes bacterium]|nr:DUF362 domain-containing protein [Candidatus Hydrogenedentota bacterium]HPG68887.1 DUF362 domain-containing protein [Candidatus Hydrogenedentota bacterium]
MGGTAMLGPLLKAAAQDEKPLDMVVVRSEKTGPVTDNEGVDANAKIMTEKAIEALGGMGRFVKKGDSVWIKPNMAWDRQPEQAANTNPVVVATLVKLCLDAGAKKVRVGDNPCNEAPKCYPHSGIEAAAKAAGAEVVYLDSNRFKDYDVGGKVLTQWPVYPDIVESDLVINAPIVKHHSIAKATMCMKNYMGVVSGNRGLWHPDLATCLCEITAFMKPRLCVLDATRIMTAHGPTGGNLEDVQRKDMIAAGTDIVAIDAWGAELLGHQPQDIASVAAGAEAGLGQMDYRKLAFRELSVA